MHTFHNCLTHPKCRLAGWYLELRPDDRETLLKVLKAVTALYYGKFGMDPRFKNKEIGEFYNPSRLAAHWLQSVEALLREGPILVNANGGVLQKTNVTILETVESEDLHWNVRYEGEIITISRWPKGKHYYLTSNKNRMFSPNRFSTYEAAEREARHYVSEDHVHVQLR
jgi:hypothetical protein